MNNMLTKKASPLDNSNNNVNNLFIAEELIDLGQYWRTVKRAKWSIIALTILGFIIGGFIASSAVPVYKASSKILADPQTPNADRNEQYVATALVFLYYETQYEIIKSRNIAEVVVDKLNLVEKYKKEQLKAKEQTLKDTIKLKINEYKNQLITYIDPDKKPVTKKSSIN